MSEERPIDTLAGKLKLHWHVILTHFPVSLFLMAAGFMALHLFTDTECFELAGFISLLAGFALLVPTTLTGWWTWRRKYRAAMTPLFRYKISMSVGMIVVCAVLAGLRGYLANTAHDVWHWVFGAGFLVLFIGAMAEGSYGGKLNHH